MELRTAVRGAVAALAAVLAVTLALLGAPPPAAAGQPGTAQDGSGQAAGQGDAERYEAEDGELHGVSVAATAPGHSGTGYVEGFDQADDRVTITVPDSPGGLHELTVHHRAPYGQKNAVLRLNGDGLGEVTFPEGTEFAAAPAGKVLLAPGTNTITVVNGWGWYEIDAITLAPVPPRPPHQVTGEPVNPRATPEARSLLRYLADHYGTHILSGQQDMAGIRWLEENIGRAPAVAGLDMMDYSPSRVERGTTSQEIENALAWDERGGVTTFVWHWNAPTGLIDEPGGREWWRGFYTDATTFDLAAALADPQSEEYALLLRDIDAIAGELARLRDAGVPVLWRPLHEAEGGWFWWGAKGPGPAKELYRLMYERMTGHHGLHNLVWVWNSVDPAWYPGDDVVDIVSADSYAPAGDHGPVSGPYEKLVELGEDRKLVALTEVGPIPDPDLLAAYEADWSWFVTWSGDFLTDGRTNSRAHLEHVYGHPRVVTLDELGDFKQHGGCTATHEVTDRWGTGYLGSVTVTGTGEGTADTWRVAWRLPAGQGVSGSWGADVTARASGDAATTAVRAVPAAWNARLGPGGQAVFGLVGGTALPDDVVPAPSCTTG
ncbi:glycosyl hydrolase [Streptomyces sp. TRM 70351]|uniref:glycosyl hydrolase n=1 Tax=Streptomyces sp. TRM 70351 TaxID=3116552 RepID=UPI002E7B39D8|nr:glycosyl hydrolase [Streptomyces sp. TRM 70351]MEE1928577.1 glycosyl hydrolase [Streptomyces sp. TRM 70351]